MCGKRYNTTYGVLIEIVTRTSGGPARAMYARAEFPPQDIQDLKFLCVQEKLRHCRTPEELMDSLPTMKIMATDHLFTEVKEGHYRFNGEVLDELPQLKWYQLYNLTKDDETLTASPPPAPLEEGARSARRSAPPPPPPPPPPPEEGARSSYEDIP